MGKSILLGVADTARKAKAGWIGGANGKARKIKAGWIGDAAGIARQFLASSVNVFATAAYERGGNGATTNDFRALKKGSGYAAVTFPADAALASCQKLTLHFYIVSGVSGFNTIALRTGTTKDGAFGVDTSISTPIPEYIPTATGWQSVDVTAALDADSGVARTEAAANGIKVFLRSRSNSTVGGVSGENCPFFTVE